MAARARLWGIAADEFWDGMDLRGFMAIAKEDSATNKRWDLRFGLLATLAEAPHLKKGHNPTKPDEWFGVPDRTPPTFADLVSQLGAQPKEGKK